jgi:hypothetical protein
MTDPVLIAVLGALVTAFGWLVNNVLTRRREEQKQRTEAQLRHVQRQLEELYGPLAFLIYEGRRTFEDLLETLGRSHVFFRDRPLPENELRTWLYWAEADFLPRNEKIKSLLMSKTHLLEGSDFPPSHLLFLDHCNSWALSHRRWKDQGVEYSWHSKINWPADFEEDVVKTFQELRAHHAALIGRLSPKGTRASQSEQPGTWVTK